LPGQSKTLRTGGVTGCALHGKGCTTSLLIPERSNLPPVTSAQDIFGDEYGLLPTPVADDTGWRKRPYSQGGRALSFVLGGPVNPEFAEWLMGWPIGWTGCEPLGTDRMLEWWRLHGACCSTPNTKAA
jgi:hypothetical protein